MVLLNNPLIFSSIDGLDNGLKSAIYNACSEFKKLLDTEDQSKLEWKTYLNTIPDIAPEFYEDAIRNFDLIWASVKDGYDTLNGILEGKYQGFDAVKEALYASLNICKNILESSNYFLEKYPSLKYAASLVVPIIITVNTALPPVINVISSVMQQLKVKKKVDIKENKEQDNKIQDIVGNYLDKQETKASGLTNKLKGSKKEINELLSKNLKLGLPKIEKSSTINILETILKFCDEIKALITSLSCNKRPTVVDSKNMTTSKEDISKIISGIERTIDNLSSSIIDNQVLNLNNKMHKPYISVNSKADKHASFVSKMSKNKSRSIYKS